MHADKKEESAKGATTLNAEITEGTGKDKETKGDAGGSKLKRRSSPVRGCPSCPRLSISFFCLLRDLRVSVVNAEFPRLACRRLGSQGLCEGLPRRRERGFDGQRGFILGARFAFAPQNGQDLTGAEMRRGRSGAQRQGRPAGRQPFLPAALQAYGQPQVA